MNTKHIAAATLFAIAFAGRVAGAQSATPSPKPLQTPIAFSAHAHIAVAVSINGSNTNGSAQLAIAQRENLSRIDVISLQSDAFPIPNQHVAFVVDRIASTIAVWNETSKTYYVQSILPRSTPTPAPGATATPSPVPKPPTTHRSPFADLAILAFAFKLTDHTTTTGLATTGLTVNFDMRKATDKATSHVIVNTELADDFASFPVTLDASIDPGTAAFKGTIKYAIDDFTRGTPPTTRFDIPAGYSEADSLLAVFLGKMPVKK